MSGGGHGGGGHGDSHGGADHAPSSGGASIGVPALGLAAIYVLGYVIDIARPPRVDLTPEHPCATIDVDGGGKRSAIVQQHFGHRRLKATCKVPFVIILANGKPFSNREPWPENRSMKPEGNPDKWLYDEVRFSLVRTGKDQEIVVTMLPNPDDKIKVKVSPTRKAASSTAQTKKPAQEWITVQPELATQ